MYCWSLAGGKVYFQIVSSSYPPLSPCPDIFSIKIASNVKAVAHGSIPADAVARVENKFFSYIDHSNPALAYPNYILLRHAADSSNQFRHGDSSASIQKSHVEQVLVFPAPPPNDKYYSDNHFGGLT